ncbi:MAG: hypothetical protein KJO21_13140 [Verrucomicrobiae bacterium]|nr:hypothetical protein [Verrucomicrobiae bacterium]NNJ44050.1 hypothetical protein [Akkermansiaceae bacterium]
MRTGGEDDPFLCLTPSYSSYWVLSYVVYVSFTDQKIHYFPQMGLRETYDLRSSYRNMGNMAGIAEKVIP